MASGSTNPRSDRRRASARRKLTVISLVAAAVTGLVAVRPAGQASAATTKNPNGYWTQYGYNAGHTSFDPAETILGVNNVTSLVPAWVAPVPSYNNVYASFIVTSAVYVSGSGPLEKLSLATGHAQWTASYGATSPMAAGGSILVDGLDALSPATGAVVWRDFIGNPALSSADGTTAFVTTQNNILDAVDATTGQILWHTGYYHMGSPSEGDGMVYVASGASGLIALSEATGAQLWVQSKGYGTPVYANGTVYSGSYLPSDSYALTAYQATTGKALWSFPGGCSTAPAVANGVVYCARANGNLAALSATTGEVLWTSATGANPDGALLAVADGVVYVPGANHVLSAVNATDGTVLWQSTLGGPVTSVVVSDGALYATANNATLHAWRLP